MSNRDISRDLVQTTCLLKVPGYVKATLTMNMSVVGGFSVVTINVKPTVEDPRAGHLIKGTQSYQLGLYVGEAGLRMRARLLAHNLRKWFRDVAGGELHDNNTIMEESLEGVRFQLLANYFQKSTEKIGATDDVSPLCQYALVCKAACLTTDDFLLREIKIIDLPGFDFAGVESTSFSNSSTSGFNHSNGVRVVFGPHFITHNKSPLNVNSRNRIMELANELIRHRNIVTNNAQAVQRHDWNAVRRNTHMMSLFIENLQSDTLFDIPHKFRLDWNERLGESNSMEDAVNAGAFKLFDVFLIACCALVRVCFVARSSFLQVRTLQREKPSVTVFRERVEKLAFGVDMDVDELLEQAGSKFREVVETAQREANLEHAYLMSMDDSRSGVFLKPARKYRAGDLYKLSMEKLGKTNLKLGDDECVAFGKDIVSKKVLGKRVIRTKEEQMVEAADAFGYCQYLGPVYSCAAVMLAVLNIIKSSKCGGSVFDCFVFDKMWEDICVATCFDKAMFTQVILDYFPIKVSLCNTVARKNPTGLYPAATYLAMTTRARAMSVTIPRDKASWLWQTTEVATSAGEGSCEIVPDEALFVHHLRIFKISQVHSDEATEFLKIAGSWYRVKRYRNSNLLQLARKCDAPGENVEVSDVNDVMLG